MALGRGDADGQPPWRSTVSGRVDVTHLMLGGRRRAVRIYLPPGYEQSDLDYPVLFMFDGQNLFDRTTTQFGMEWGIDETQEALVGAGRTDGVVVVGIDSAAGPRQRYAEYTAWDWHLDGRPVHARGSATAAFLVEQVLPYVQGSYRVTNDRAQVGLAGSSMGGYMALYTGMRHTELFGRLLAFSPVLLDEPMGGGRLRAALATEGFDPGTWVYLDMGDREELGYSDDPRRLVEDLRRTSEAVAGAARPPQRVVSRVIPGAAHDELAWGARFGEVLLWAFADGPAPG
jgi:predicted alpha/beta superfamily hydrolase